MKLFEIKKHNNKKKVYFCGIQIYSGKIKQYLSLNNKTQKIDNIEQQINKLSQLIMKQHEEIQHYPEMISRLTQRNIAAAFAHQKIFSQFENCFEGKDVVLVATGPSLNDFIPIKDAVYVGVNNTFKKDDIKIDYLFIHDYRGAKNYISEANEYRRGQCTKFYGICADFIEGALVPKSEAVKAGAYYYRADYEETPFWKPKHVYDILSQPLGCMSSIVFPAMQFILWGNPRRIYLVGCDSSDNGNYDDLNNISYRSVTIPEWKQIKHLAEIYYPDTEIISINPVGLKGMFKDFYQKKEQ